MTQTTTHPEATPARAARGLLLPCPYCGEQGASIDLHLPDLSFTCQDCEAEFTAGDVRSIIDRWSKVLVWVDACPDR